MRHISIQMLQSAIDAIPERTFDSHKVIRELMRQNPQAYVRELYERVAHNDPIQSTHAQIGKWLVELGSLAKLPRISSINVRSDIDDATENQQWERLAP